MEKELKTEQIIIKVTPTFKEMAQKRAEEEARTLSGYITYLILKDMEKEA